MTLVNTLFTTQLCHIYTTEIYTESVPICLRLGVKPLNSVVNIVGMDNSVVVNVVGAIATQNASRPTNIPNKSPADVHHTYIYI